MIPSKRTRIALLSEFFPPATGATSQLVYDLTTALSSGLLEITVITAQKAQIPKNSSSIKTADLALLNKFYLALPSKTLRGIAFCLFSFAYLLFTPQFSRLLIVSNPPFVGVVGLITKIIRKTPYLFLFQDIFPKTAVLAGILPPKGPLHLFWVSVMNIICTNSERVLVLSPGMAYELQRQHLNLQNIVAVHNWAVEYSQSRNDATNPYSIKWSTSDRLTFQYSGNFGQLHDMLTILETARSTQNLPVSYLFVGEGGKKEQILSYIQSYNLTNTKLYPYVPRHDLKYSLGACSIGIISLVPGSQDLVSPSKLLGILASSRPVLLICSQNCFLSTLVVSNNLGFVIEPGDVTALVKLVKSLVSDPSQLQLLGRNARRFYLQHYSKQAAVNLYSQYLLQD